MKMMQKVETGKERNRPIYSKMPKGCENESVS